MKNNITAPLLDELITSATKRSSPLNEPTKELVLSLFRQMEVIAPIGDDNLRKLWLTAERGALEDFGDYEEYIAAGDVSGKAEFEALWLSYYPDPIKWYKLTTASFDGNYIVLINDTAVLRIIPELDSDKENSTALAGWICEAVGNAIESLRVGTYNEFVADNLPYKKRTGTLPRADYWSIFPEEKETYLENITQEDIVQFGKALSVQETGAITARLPSMASGMFFDCCRLGYEANHYSGIDTMTAKELYRAHADGRDDGLLELDGSSAVAFSEWFNGKRLRIGHPWEVCRGGNSTHISLYVKCDDDGWWLVLAGDSYSRSVETIKFYLALVDNGLPVFMQASKNLLAMVTGRDCIGIVSEDVFPRYCHGLFPEDDILDFMHLPDEKTEEVIAKTTWQPIETVTLVGAV